MPTPRIQKLAADMAATDGVALTAYRANPITFRITLDSARPLVDGVESLRAELRRSVTDYTTPLAVTEISAPTGSGPVDISFTGAQMNQGLDGKASGLFWLVIYTVDDAGETLDIWHAGKFTIKEHAASLTAAAPPNVVGPLSKTAADLLYPPFAAGGASLASQAEAEAGTVNTKYMTPLRVLQAIIAAIGTRIAGLIFGRVAPSVLPTATTSTVGAVMADGITVTVDQHGRLSSPPLQLSTNGSVRLSWDSDGSLRGDLIIS